MIPNSFERASTFLGSKTARTIASKRSTQVVRLSSDEIALRYHDTYVVTWHRNGDVTLRTGGYRSVTTKARINDAAPCRVWQHEWKWYVGQSSRVPVVPFEEGMVVRPLPLPY